jgi:hypothetical protein
MRKTWIPLVIITCYLLVTSNAHACACLPKPSVKQALKQSTAVFSGRVNSIQKNPGAGNPCGCLDCCLKVEFQVERIWKGSNGRVIVVTTGTGDTDCGFYFEIGESYLVYALKGSHTLLSTDTCSRTKKLTSANGDIKRLKKPQVGYDL